MRRRLGRFAPEAIGLLLIVLAFVPGLRATQDLAWPGDVDLYRDIAQAQTFADGDWLADPQYRGESLWYNPLTPALVAVISRVTAQPIPQLYTQLGAYLNLLAPIGLYILVAVLINRWAALAALFAFLFVAPATHEPAWALGTYSPWLFTANFAPGWFCLTLAAYVIAARRQTRRWYVLAGALLGVTFLTHTAPAVILGLIIGLHTLWRVMRRRAMRASLIGFGLIILTALIVSAPLIISIAGRYHLRVLNPAPTNWAYEPLTLRNFEAFIQDNVVNRIWFWAVVAAGLIGLAWQPGKRLEGGLMWTWLLIAMAFLIYHYARQLAKRNGVILPTVVPGFHFLLYVRLALSVLWGVGLVTLGVFLARRLPSRLGIIRPWLAGGLVAIALIGLWADAYPAYLDSDDLAAQRIDAIANIQNTDRVAAYAWVRANTRPQDVFLAPDAIGTYVIGPAGRKVVVGDSVFVSPYVDWAARNADRDTMFSQLQANNCAAFESIAAKYELTYVAVGNKLAQGIDAAAPACVEKVLAGESVRVYRVTR